MYKYLWLICVVYLLHVNHMWDYCSFMQSTCTSVVCVGGQFIWSNCPNFLLSCISELVRSLLAQLGTCEFLYCKRSIVPALKEYWSRAVQYVITIQCCNTIESIVGKNNQNLGIVGIFITLQSVSSMKYSCNTNSV